MTNEDVIAERAETIRDLTRGEGLTESHVNEVLQPSDLDRLFGVNSAPELIDLIEFSIDAIPSSHQVTALLTALAPKKAHGKNLSERRQAYIEYMQRTSPEDVPSLRTLIRWEAEGAENLAEFIDTARSLKPSPGNEVSALEERIATLEFAVTLLLSDALDDGWQQAMNPVLVTKLEAMFKRFEVYEERHDPSAKTRKILDQVDAEEVAHEARNSS